MSDNDRGHGGDPFADSDSDYLPDAQQSDELLSDDENAAPLPTMATLAVDPLGGEYFEHGMDVTELLRGMAATVPGEGLPEPYQLLRARRGGGDAAAAAAAADAAGPSERGRGGRGRRGRPPGPGRGRGRRVSKHGCASPLSPITI